MMKVLMRCPKCGNGKLARILYGLPVFDDKLEKDLADGKVVLGGCGEEEKCWHCNSCKYEF